MPDPKLVLQRYAGFGWIPAGGGVIGINVPSAYLSILF
jgi:hypothetical protein